MRQVVFKNLFSHKSRKREISIEETVNQDGVTSKMMKRSKYYVRDISHIDNKQDFDKWVKEKKTNPSCNNRQFHVLKVHSEKEKKDKVFCKAIGSFYAVIGKDIYNIVFVHSVKMEIESLENKGD